MRLLDRGEGRIRWEGRLSIPAGLPQAYTDVVTGNFILCSDDAKYMNHSDTPNTRTEGHQTVATADIQPGQEITCNYFEFDAGTRRSTVVEWDNVGK